MVDCGWWLVGRCMVDGDGGVGWVVDCGWWMVDGRWMDGGCCMVVVVGGV